VQVDRVVVHRAEVKDANADAMTQPHHQGSDRRYRK
jgi:hypothetical protein